MAKRKTVKIVAAGRKLEGSVSSELRSELSGLGILSYKISDRYHSGVPDIYIPNGIWIESKVIPRLPTKIVPPMRYFSGPQRKEANALVEAGDEVLAALYFQFDMTNRAFCLVPWYEFVRIAVWDLETIQSLGVIVPPRRAPDFHLRRFFNKDHPLKYDPKIWWDDAFDAWLAKNPDKYDPDRRVGHYARGTWDDENPEDTELQGHNEKESAD